MKAHQRIIREQCAECPDVTLFGIEGEGIDTSLDKSTVRTISTDAASRIILKYEWLGTMPLYVQQCFGLYHDGALAGALVFAEKPGNNLASNHTSLIPADALYLARGACVHWAHPHAASWFIARACHMLAPCTVLAYADAEAGEVGTIYQALNWLYLGVSPGGPHGYVIDGVRVAARSMNRERPCSTPGLLFDDPDNVESVAPINDGALTQGIETARALYPHAKQITPIARKGRYVGIYGNRRYKRAMLQRLLPAQQPYPKRKPEKE